MRAGLISGASGMAAALAAGAFLFPRAGIADVQRDATRLEQGRELAIEYCQACHYFEGTDQAGTVGPPLLAMRARFPEREELEKRIYDPQVAYRPDTMMPPFGRNRLLDEQQIRLIVDFLYTL
jgi:sulfur-oxidizing protein SoxX